MVGFIGLVLRAIGMVVRRVLPIVFFVLLAGCTVSLPYVDPYNAEIETELNIYHKSAVEFLKSAAQDGAQAGFTSEKAKAFYAAETARLANLIVRGQAIARRDRCAPTRFPALDGTVQALSSEAADQQQDAGKAFMGGFGADVSLDDGSCLVVALKAVQANQNRLEAIHKRNGKLNAYQAELSSGFISDAVRIALTIEASSKP